MWIVFGHKVTTERVPGGASVERRCEKCGELSMFYERRAVTTVQLYFLDVLDVSSRRVMACGACGELYATDELGAGAGVQPKVSASLKEAAQRAGAAITGGASKAYARISDAARAQLGGGARADAARAGGGGEPDGADPLADEDEALSEKFRELERKVRIADD